MFKTLAVVFKIFFSSKNKYRTFPSIEIRRRLSNCLKATID